MRIASILIIVLVTSGAFMPIAPAEFNNLEWDKDAPLTWADFLGEADPKSYGDAATTIKIQSRAYYKRNKLRYDVNTYFVRNRSWCRTKSGDLLRHEQLHFDIAELYARKIRRRISELQQHGIKDGKVIHRSVQQILDESNLEDRRYDTETLHGALREKQDKWTRTIGIELQIMERFGKERWNAGQ